MHNTVVFIFGSVERKFIGTQMFVNGVLLFYMRAVNIRNGRNLHPNSLSISSYWSAIASTIAESRN